MVGLPPAFFRFELYRLDVSFVPTTTPRCARDGVANGGVHPADVCDSMRVTFPHGVFAISFFTSKCIVLTSRACLPPLHDVSEMTLLTADRILQSSVTV